MGAVKTCFKCGMSKPESDFSRHSASRDGLHPRCRECKNAAERERCDPIRDEINAKERERYLSHKKEHSEKFKRYMANPENRARKIAQQKQWSEEHPDKIAEYSLAWRQRNPEKNRENHRKHYRETIEQQHARMLEYQRNNLHIYAANEAKRRAGKRNATPKWLTTKQIDLMKCFYIISDILSEMTGTRHHVDHIHPLKGKNFSGLHVPWNLRVIPSFDNMSKGNKLLIGV